MSAPHLAPALEIRAAALEACILSLLRELRQDAEGYEVPGELALTVQASANGGDVSIDLTVTLDQRPVLGMSL